MFSARPTACADAAQDGAHAKHELLRAEGLGEIVVGAEGKTLNAVGLFAPRRQHEHGDVARGIGTAELLQHVIAGDARQHEIENDQGRSIASRDLERLRPRAGRGHPITTFGEMVCNEGNDVCLVVDDEDALAR